MKTTNSNIASKTNYWYYPSNMLLSLGLLDK